MEWLILPVVAILITLVLRSIRREFTAYSKRVVAGATVEYGDKRGLPTVRVTIGGLVHTEVFRVRSDAEDYFTDFGRDELAEILSLVGDKS